MSAIVRAASSGTRCSNISIRLSRTAMCSLSTSTSLLCKSICSFISSIDMVMAEVLSTNGYGNLHSREVSLVTSLCHRAPRAMRLADSSASPAGSVTADERPRITNSPSRQDISIVDVVSRRVCVPVSASVLVEIVDRALWCQAANWWRALVWVRRDVFMPSIVFFAA